MASKMKSIVMLARSGFRYRKKAACFDFDNTLVKPKENRIVSKDVNDWIWLQPNIPNILHNYYKHGFAIVIFTNQNKHFKIQQIQTALDSIGNPYKAYIAFDKTLQKPNPCMFEMYKRPNFDYNNSFYVGDALGHYGDWGDSDKKFADAAGLRAVSPKQIFPSQKQKLPDEYRPRHPGVVIMVGYPGSGKTTTAKINFGQDKNFVILDGNALKTEAALKKALRLHLLQ